MLQIRRAPQFQLILAGVLSTLPAVALAHEGHHEQMPAAAAVRHLLTQPDHVLALAGLMGVAVAGGWAWRRSRARARR